MGSSPGKRTPVELALSMAETMGWDKEESVAALDGATAEIDVDAAFRRLAASKLKDATADGGGGGGGELAAPKGWISVDGEQAQYGRVQVQVQPGRGRILMLADSPSQHFSDSKL